MSPVRPERRVDGEADAAADADASAARASDDGPLPAWLAVALVSGTSAAVLVLEILAGRLLAPFVGVSLQTFTSIIGTILAGIAIGAWSGGLLADRVDPRRVLPILLTLGGALAITTIPVVRVLGEIGDDGGGGGPRSLALTAAGFFPAAAVLSAVPPAVVKLQLRDLAATGSTVGRLSAWSTAGALFGTFFTGFVLISVAAVTTLIVAVGLALLAAGLALWATVRIHRPGELLGVVGLAAVSLTGLAMIDSPCDTQTAYYCVAILDDPSHPSGRTLVLDDLRHSYVDLDDPTRLEFWYVRRIVDAIDVAGGDGGRALDIVYLGGGGLTIPRYVRATRPGSSQTVFEIDGDLVRVVEDELGFEHGDDVDIVVGDGRLGLRDRPDDSADVVVGDAFGGRAVPFHLATAEFMAEIDRVLRADGIYAANIIDGRGELFARAEAATIATVFPHVVVIRGPFAVRGRGGNSVIVAGRQPIDVDALAARLAADVDPTDGVSDEAPGELVAGPSLSAYLDGATILTDDFAPVDHLLAGVR